MEPPFDPGDYSVSELTDALEDVDDPEALTAILEAERGGTDRKTAREAIEERLQAVGSEPHGGAQSGPSEGPERQPMADSSVKENLLAALRYPWDAGEASITLVIGGILTLLSPLIIPGIVVVGYSLSVIETVLAGGESPPSIDDWQVTFIEGVKGGIVLVLYVVLPLVVGAAVLVGVASASQLRVSGGLLPLTAGPATGLVFVLALVLAGLAIVVWYFTPAAIIHLARTRRLRAAFDFEEVRRLAATPAYGATWLVALAVFTAASVVMAVLYAAAIGVIVSGFVTFYTIVAISYLFANGAESAGYGVSIQEETPE